VPDGGTTFQRQPERPSMNTSCIIDLALAALETAEGGAKAALERAQKSLCSDPRRSSG
jgi:hypothetical protein